MLYCFTLWDFLSLSFPPYSFFPFPPLVVYPLVMMPSYSRGQVLANGPPARRTEEGHADDCSSAVTEVGSARWHPLDGRGWPEHGHWWAHQTDALPRRPPPPPSLVLAWPAAGL